MRLFSWQTTQAALAQTTELCGSYLTYVCMYLLRLTPTTIRQGFSVRNCKVKKVMNIQSECIYINYSHRIPTTRIKLLFINNSLTVSDIPTPRVGHYKAKVNCSNILDHLGVHFIDYSIKAEFIFFCRYGPATGTIWFVNVRCSGSESRLISCPRTGLRSHNCSHSDDLAIDCSFGNLCYYLL